MPRLFTGLEIPPEVCQTLSSLRGGLPGARWIDPENYHVTLRFIGDIDGVSANEIAMLLARIDRKPFEVTVQGLTSFGGRKPRAVVATIAPSRPLIELQAELERLMQRLGFDPEGRKFIPLVSVIQVGTSVSIPNNDTVRHHVYSFSPAKVFDIKLYSGQPANPIVFDKPGTVILGCNIHDQMLAYIQVVPTPWFAKTDASGTAVIESIPAGKYQLKAWHYGLPPTAPIPEQAVTVSGADLNETFKLNAKATLAN